MKGINDYMFARWVVMHYTSDYLNEITGAKWNELYSYYNKYVKPNHIKNGSYKDNKEFLETPNIKPQEIVIKEVIKEIPLKTVYVPFEESNGCGCGQPSCTFGCA
jgi:hypothetical protein